MTTPAKSKEQIMAEMDASAEVADKEFYDMCEKFDKLEDRALKSIVAWMRRHRLTAGYKRLGKILLAEEWRK